MRSFLLVSLVLIPVFHCLPLILNVSRTQIFGPGRTAQVQCDFLNATNHTYGWMKSDNDGKTIGISTNEKISIADSRFSVSRILISPSGHLIRTVLQIDNLNIADNGTYICFISINNVLMLYNSTSLLIVPDDVKHGIVLQGDHAYLECISSEFNFNEIVCTKYQEPSLPVGSTVNNGVLKIPSVDIKDIGYYMCRVEFFDGLSIQRGVVLEVVPPLEVSARSSNLVRPNGYDVNMTCIIYSIKPVLVVWNVNNAPLSSLGSKYQTHLYETSTIIGSLKRSVKIAELTVRNINDNDYDLYDCTVENEFGVEAATIRLSQITGA